MRDVSFGQYYPVDSVVHRVDARVKLIVTIVYIAALFFVNTFTGYAIAFLFAFTIIMLSRVPFLKILRTLRAVIFLVIFTVVLTVLFYRGQDDDLLGKWWIFSIYRSALISSGKLTIRIILLIMGPSLLTFTTTPVALTDGLERLLKPLSYIKVPVHELAMIMNIALRLIPTLVEETGKIMSAQKARGAEFESGNIFKRAKAFVPILIPLFVSSFRRADELADAMDSRCYRGAVGRTRMKIMKIKARDIVTLILFAAFLFFILLLRYNWWGFGFITFLLPY